jgi:hypothetical protein
MDLNLLGTQQGQADGFNIELLEHLNDVKDSLGNKSVLHMIVEIIHESYPDASDLTHELPHLNHATKTSFDDIRQKLNSLSSSVKNILFIMLSHGNCGV